MYFYKNVPSSHMVSNRKWKCPAHKLLVYSENKCNSAQQTALASRHHVKQHVFGSTVYQTHFANTVLNMCCRSLFLNKTKAICKSLGDNSWESLVYGQMILEVPLFYWLEPHLPHSLRREAKMSLDDTRGDYRYNLLLNQMLATVNK